MFLIFLDTETCGLRPEVHRILELAFRIVCSDTYEVVASYSSLVKHEDREVWAQRSEESCRITGLDEAFVNYFGKTEEVVAEEVLAIFSQVGVTKFSAVFVCQNPGMDRSFFSQLISVDRQQQLGLPYHWFDLASMFWALEVMERGHVAKNFSGLLSKNNIATYFGLAEEKMPHRALQGVDHLIECYRMLMENGLRKNLPRVPLTIDVPAVKKKSLSGISEIVEKGYRK
ncbi:3'-5' exonuclease [Chlamydiifrater phoenicopteri]|uniref:3'-5' exonuclease n=1 Tax=Chlamydiifrater phoenicopteri TaxID=2681469 RepID=UPI001BD1515E|nr:3'-5' exonuclease [Chlamydiifrater phoenicopteri]